MEYTACYFRAGGPEFDVDAFLADSSLLGYGVFHRGDCVSGDRVRESSGFSITLSVVWGDFPAQQVEVIEFLREHQAEICRLSRYPGITELLIDFSWAEANVPVQAVTFSPEFLKLAGACGVSVDVTLYAYADDTEEADAPNA